MKNLTWDDLLAMREQIIGKDIEYESYGKVYRGPIKAFLLDERNVVFIFKWLAYREVGKELETKWY